MGVAYKKRNSKIIDNWWEKSLGTEIINAIALHSNLILKKSL